MPSKGDLKFGHLAIELGHCEKGQLEECLKQQAVLEKQGKVTSIDRVLLKKGYITAAQIAEIEKKQGRRIIFCSKCSAKLNVAIFGAGTKIRCPKCDASLVVPAGTKYEAVEKGEDEEEKPKTPTLKIKTGQKPASAPPRGVRPPSKPPKKEEPADEDLLGSEPVDEVEELEEEVEEGAEAAGGESGEEGGEAQDSGIDLIEEKEESGGSPAADSDIEILDDVEEEAEDEKPAKARQNDPTEKVPLPGKGKAPPPKPGVPAAKPGVKPGGAGRLDRFKKK